MDIVYSCVGYYTCVIVYCIAGRWSHYVHIKELWKNFEATVKDFLEWLMAEGKSFSKDVTTLGGVKGVSDHMKTCEVSRLIQYIIHTDCNVHVQSWTHCEVIKCSVVHLIKCLCFCSVF